MEAGAELVTLKAHVKDAATVHENSAAVVEVLEQSLLSSLSRTQEIERNLEKISIRTLLAGFFDLDRAWWALFVVCCFFRYFDGSKVVHLCLIAARK